MIASSLLAVVLLHPAAPSAVPPSLTLDLDGDGTEETVTVAPGRGTVRVEVRDAGGRTLAEAKAPAPKGDVVSLGLTSGPLGGAGALVEVVALTDKNECRTFWRYRDGALTRLPARDASGKPLPECASPGGWTSRWESAGGGRPAAWIRERTETSAAGALSTREAYAFAGFSLDFDAARSGVQIDGIPIPDWYPAVFYSRAALEILYSRFGFDAFRAEPTLRIEADRRRGVFALRLAGPRRTLEARVESYAATPGTVTLGVRAGERTANVLMRFSADARVPLSATLEGLGPDWDRAYAPAGAWRGGARQVFPNAADELAVEDLAGTWSGPLGKNHVLSVEGEPPYRLRAGEAVWTVAVDGAAPFDALLLPVGGAGRAWGLTLRGPNALDRVPVACAGPPPAPACHADGDRETLRRVGARINVR